MGVKTINVNPSLIPQKSSLTTSEIQQIIDAQAAKISEQNDPLRQNLIKMKEELEEQQIADKGLLEKLRTS